MLIISFFKSKGECELNDESPIKIESQFFKIMTKRSMSEYREPSL